MAGPDSVPESNEVRLEVAQRIAAGEEVPEVGEPLSDMADGLVWNGILAEAWILQHAIDRWCGQAGLCDLNPSDEDRDTAISDGCLAHTILEVQRRLDGCLEGIRRGEPLPQNLMVELGAVKP